MSKLFLITMMILGILQEEPGEETNWLLLAGKILITILTLALVAWQDLSVLKEPFDKQKKSFKWRRDWWKYRNDNVIVMWILGLIGAVVSGEIAMPLLNKYLDWPELAEGTLDLFGVFIVTYMFAKYFSRIFGIKPPEVE